jgi:hypothetical protein
MVTCDLAGIISIAGWYVFVEPRWWRILHIISVFQPTLKDGDGISAGWRRFGYRT